MYTSQEQKHAPTCALCGRNLGVGFYYSCHVCGATYCYAHSPQKCEHRKVPSHPLDPALSSKA
jgi:tRNA(Ile2) C34 agmatinyltransferase TiaS